MDFKRDKFQLTRGGYSRMLKVSCGNCGYDLLIYQKDGPGNLRRLFIDRIIAPNSLVILTHKQIKSIPDLNCPGCSLVIGTPYIYEKENRKAFRVYQDAITKQIIPLDQLAKENSFNKLFF